MKLKTSSWLTTKSRSHAKCWWSRYEEKTYQHSLRFFGDVARHLVYRESNFLKKISRYFKNILETCQNTARTLKENILRKFVSTNRKIYRDACLLMDQVNKRGDFRRNFLVHSISVTHKYTITYRKMLSAGLRSYASFFSPCDEII